MSVFGNHEAALVASMDCAVDDLLDALNDADQLGPGVFPHTGVTPIRMRL